MPRNLRLEFEGARYHVLNRGNYRQDLFRVHRTGEVFREALFAACQRYQWVLHAYVVMRNHYHLALETPLGNLSVGMQYLQSVFSNRFNKFVQERGHVFQGRYKALVLEDTTALLQVVDYIHLNPVRAGIVSVGDLRSYRMNSFAEFFRKKGRSKFLTPAEFLHEAGGLSDSVSGMRAYQRRLEWIMEEDPKKREEGFARLCRGWYVGTDEGKAVLAGLVQKGGANASAELQRELEEVRWARLLAEGMEAIGKTLDDLQRDLKSAEWKIALGAWLKLCSGVPNRWMADRLHMGNFQTASKHVTNYSKARMRTCPVARKLESIPRYQA